MRGTTLRGTALVLGAAFALSQLVGQPAMAMEPASPDMQIQGKTEGARTPHGDPPGPSASDSLSAGPIGDMKVELDSAWWEGDTRHSQFKVSNIGTGKSFNVRLFRQYFVRKSDGSDDDHFEYKQELGDVPAGAVQYVDVVCTPKPGWECYWTRAKALPTGSDLNAANDGAEDTP